MEEELRINIILTLLVLSSLVLLIAYQFNFFKTPQPFKSKVTLFQVLGSFLAFLISPVILGPMLIAGILIYSGVDPSNLSHIDMSLEQKGLINLTVLCCTALMLSIYVYLNQDVVHQFFDPDHKGGGWMLKQFGMGLVGCLIAMPLVFALSQVLDLILETVYNIPPIEQNAVVHLKGIGGNPILFFITIAFVSTIVPIMEELLFRGFLQSWLMKYFSIENSIIATSIIFAGFHFASQQSWYNIQIVGALFILSIFLGFVYVRQRSLWAPIALHSLFNLIGVTGIFLKIS